MTSHSPASPARPVRAVIVGTGNIARVHANALHELADEVQIVAES